MNVDRETIRRRHRHADHRRIPRHPVVVLGDRLDKDSNIGSIVRTAEALLVEKVLLTRTEIDTRGAMGAEHWQPIEWGVDAASEIAMYRSRGYRIVALEQLVDSTPLPNFAFPKRVMLVAGAELFGVSPELLGAADDIVHIPQVGLVKSMNVGVAVAIALYEYSRQHWLKDAPPSQRHLAPSMESIRAEGMKDGGIER